MITEQQLKEYRERTYPILIANGASPEQANDLLSEITLKCLKEGDQNLLLKKKAEAPLQYWLATVSKNRLKDLQRREARITINSETTEIQQSQLSFESEAEEADSEFCLLIENAVLVALNEEDPFSLLLIVLHYYHGIAQNDLSEKFYIEKTKLNRMLKGLLQSIFSRVTDLVKAKDQLIDLTQNDLRMAIHSISAKYSL